MFVLYRANVFLHALYDLPLVTLTTGIKTEFEIKNNFRWFESASKLYLIYLSSIKSMLLVVLWSWLLFWWIHFSITVIKRLTKRSYLLTSSTTNPLWFRSWCVRSPNIKWSSPLGRQGVGVGNIQNKICLLNTTNAR